MTDAARMSGSVPAVLIDVWDAAGAAMRSLAALAPLVYLVTALPTVIFLATLTPPFQAPDEDNHFRRAVQLLDGQVIGHDIQAPGWSGGRLPKSVGKVGEAFSYLIGHPDRKFSPEIMRDARAVAWTWTDREFSSFANTVIYPPVFYLPTMGAIAVGRSLGWGVLDSYRLARLTNGVVSVLIAATAIALAVSGRSLLFVFLSFPMSLYLFASVSQDALLIACTGLAIGLCSRALGHDRPLGSWEHVIVVFLFGAAIAARPPYVFLLAVLLMPGIRPESRGKGTWASLEPVLPALAALAIGVGWIVFGAGPSQTPMRVEAGVSIPEQLKLMLSHPMLFPSALLKSLAQELQTDLQQAIGVLGWSDTPLPGPYYRVTDCALLTAAGLAFFESGRRNLWRWGLVLVAACGLTGVGVYGVLYLSWTPVGADSVDGVQGRYFLPAVLPLVLALSAFGSAVGGRRPARTQEGSAWRTAAWLALFCMAALGDLALPGVVFDRYFG